MLTGRHQFQYSLRGTTQFLTIREGEYYNEKEIDVDVLAEFLFRYNQNKGHPLCK